MVQVDDIKNSLRIDHSMDDKMIQELIDTASYYVISAIDGQAEDGVIEGYKQLDWAVSLLVQHWYMNRQEASSERIPITVQSLIQQMRGAYYATH
ncbi:head-tail connector protein [Vagococcus acidifermentans]|uniref:DNA-packaging protein n=1 Tax=Vagococcus acidifermentans TaxID=564710 RepID=A0A430B260_9ENTE|nr:head-tail connector protein [Vagococcus acidifermentans]RSU14410.1 DNA-packaging protein [Vagococcus acidifermentans]